ncbi:unnamed protein product [Aphanomyces euteiches]|uniref:Elicitin n=1 Tax=Aphanomyces euteiches TaxID=100861 RepID=A0A6G0WC82_9STRA|nr:hypothetical protein Ae201684_017311 [Aphanomyces euteiches]KAH9081169.1 hypothetical protein Ae201684P_012141 [Aphanomyces euteiches]KAH9107101.1 hypothetical protein LEN26_014377 [Aphanomyces euteiches]KAH9108774.1 hypothetical protein AeMF1_016091 [Aphanomyces euteiches]KAH9145128.1 hypothetical protein AeRB84_010943 [Aphanomyces euteiches]
MKSPLPLVLLSSALSSVSAVECTSSDLVPVLAPVLLNTNLALCQTDAGITISLDQTTKPSPDALAKIAASPSCEALYKAIKAALTSSSAPSCTLGGLSLTTFAGSSLGDFIVNLNAYKTGSTNATTNVTTTTAPSSAQAPSSAPVPAATWTTLVMAMAAWCFWL